MKKIMKKYMILFILIALEICIFFLFRSIRPVDIKVYFIIWIIIGLIFFYFSISDISQTSEVRGEGLRGNTYFRNFNTISAEKEFAKKNQKRRKNFFDFNSLIFLLLLLFNIVAYLFV